MLYYIIEDPYRAYPWCRNSLRSLLDEVRKRRMQIEEIRRVEDIPPEDISPVLFILGATKNWTENAIDNACRCRIYPISMSTRGLNSMGRTYSAVSMDTSKALTLAIRYLRSLGRCRTALYGVNPSSTSDPYKAYVFENAFGPRENIFQIRSSYEDMFKEFLSHAAEFDSVVCCNDYASVSLVNHLKHSGIDPTRDLYVVGIGNADISHLSHPSITMVSDDYEHFGTAAMNIYSIMRREDFISFMDISLDVTLHIRETTANRPFVPVEDSFLPTPHTDKNLFYQDSTVVRLLRMETLFNQCDETDFQIIESLLQENTYAFIAEQCFISETTAKYRIGKMKEICSVESRSELVDFLRQFIG